VNSDGGSRDGTPDIVQGVELDVGRGLLIASPERLPVRLVTGYQGIPGKGSAFRTMFEIAERLEAKACAVVDADLRSITPEWVQLLLAPVLHEGFDYVCPLYSRHKYDGTITDSIVYPLVRSCFGRRVRQPIGGDFGFRAGWPHTTGSRKYGKGTSRVTVYIWMTTTALAGDFRVCQAYSAPRSTTPRTRAAT
jgi:glycosyltransferase involved in cell wall biosynthesis